MIIIRYKYKYLQIKNIPIPKNNKNKNVNKIIDLSMVWAKLAAYINVVYPIYHKIQF